MAGNYSPTARPKRPGAYFRFEARPVEPILQSSAGTVAVCFTHDWGPGESIVELNQPGDFLSIFGGSNAAPSDGWKAVRQAFQGEGIPGSGGATRVLAFRMLGTTAAAGTRTIQNTTPANALTLTSKYQGSFAGQIKVGIQADSIAPATHDNLVIFEGFSEVERFRYAKTDITALAADINENSDWVAASGVTSGTALSPTTIPAGQTLAEAAPALTGGNDGSTVTAADYTAFRDALASQRFSVVAASNLTDASVVASFKSWSQTANNTGKRFITVVGGALDETLTTAIARSTALNDPNFVNIGIGSVTDEVLGTLSTAQLAPRIAGILAAAGGTRSLTYARLAGIDILKGPAAADYLDAIDGGLIVLAKDSHPQAPVRTDKGVTTFTAKGDADRPYAIYSSPKFVRTMHSIETELTEWAEINVIGRMQVSDATRSYVRAQMEARMAAREEAGVIQPGWVVQIDNDPPPSPEDDFVAIRYGLTFGRSVEQVFNRVVVG